MKWLKNKNATVISPSLYSDQAQGTRQPGLNASGTAPLRLGRASDTMRIAAGESLGLAHIVCWLQKTAGICQKAWSLSSTSGQPFN
jgi:hypothetical protein